MDKKTELGIVVEEFVAERGWKKYHNPKNLAMAMVKEAAEVVELFQWLTPAQAKALPPQERAKLADELADTYVYLRMLAKAYGLDLDEAALSKMRRNAAKYPVSGAAARARRR